MATRRIFICSECNHSWSMDNTVDSSECPNCLSVSMTFHSVDFVNENAAIANLKYLKD